jgi:hypothetical protein
LSTSGTRQLLPADSHEVVVKGRLSDALLRGTGTELIRCQDGLSHLLARDFDQPRLHTLFELFGDLNIELVSVKRVGQPDRLAAAPDLPK